MASLMTHKTGPKAGKRYIIFYRGNEREMIYLGGGPRQTAETVKLRVEYLLAAVTRGAPVDPDTARWLGDIDDELHGKLARVGLVEPRVTKEQADAATLGPFLDAFIARKHGSKPRTRKNLKQTRDWLIDYFKEDKPLTDITAGDGDEWRAWLATQGRKKGVKLGKNTIRRHCGRARQFFTAAKKKKLIVENPFTEMKDCGVKANRERDYFVTRDEAAKVLEACPNSQLKLMFALSRFGGLRYPSEHLALKWSDIDWERNRMTVRSPKTEHHDGKESRIIPIFPELLPHLEAAFDEAKEGTENVIANRGVRNDKMTSIIRGAGLKPWPKLFHNLRATRETELAAEFPMHVVCDWIGNSPKVAAEHYLRVTDADFDRAASTEGSQWDAPQEHKLDKSGMRQGSMPAVAGSSLLLQIVKKAVERHGLEHVGAIVRKAVQESANHFVDAAVGSI
jgi:integrase